MTQQSDHNPYEDADPIRVPAKTHHRAQSTYSSPADNRTRSRSVQSARDSAANRNQQEYLANMNDGSSHVRPTRPSSSLTRRSADQAAAQRRQPQPVRQASTRMGGTQAESRSSRVGYTPIATTRNRRPPQGGMPGGMRKRRKMGFGIIAGIIIAAIIVLAGILYWINRPVPITVNGEAAEVRVGSTLEDVMHEEHVEVSPGDYVSVSEHVLKAGAGHTYTATVNGEQLSPSDADAYRIRGSESIEYSNGGNITEEYTVETHDIKPYLRMEGSGYALQYISQWGRMGQSETRVGTESGETAEVVTKEPQDCIITCATPFFEDGRKLVALTFDDGPLSPYTEQYLEILGRYGAHATFFNLGENIEANPQLAKAVVDGGHQLANHTMAHNQLTSVDADTIYREITTSEDVIERATGVRTTHLRPPYGDFTERSWLGSRGSITASIRWTADSVDWTTPGAEAIVENSLSNVYSGMIILMHDGGGDRSQDVEALPTIIERLQGEGYEFVTMSDLMRAMGNIPEEVCSGTGTMPADAVWPDEIAPEDLAAAAS